ncbi:MAG: 3'(2'),5'-bisphosphate nucleotidase CysQ [Cryomorphaceae bacterium]|nr:3'(2'),5'-bisphosphate nucleotidase CysQ [Cryomorphaceae bacterium]
MNQLLEIAQKAAFEAGKIILRIYEQDFEVFAKSDKTPLTEADLGAHRAIEEILAPTNIPIISEEGFHTPYEERKSWKRFWLVDPLDGTKEFVKKNGDFTVNIALIEGGVPTLGVIYVPVHKTIYSVAPGELPVRYDDVSNMGDLLNPVILRGQNNRDHIVVAGSRSHTSPRMREFIDELSAKHPGVQLTSRGSSLKICLIAEGTADIYPRFGPTMEWDTAAGDAMLRALGKPICQYPEGKPLVYNKIDLHNPWFIAGKIPEKSK